MLEAVQGLGGGAVVVAGEGPAVGTEVAVGENSGDDGGEAFEVQENVDAVRPRAYEVDVDDVAIFLGWERGRWV